MLFSLVIPVALLSLFPHQEARFIIPSLIPLVYLYGNYLFDNEADELWTKRLKRVCLYSWYVINILLTVFFGFIHQGGIYSFTNNLYYEIKKTYGVHTHVITTHSYSIPTYLLQLESTSKIWHDTTTGHKYKLNPQTFIYKYGSLPMKSLFYKIDEVLSNAEMMLHEANKKYRFYIASPCSLEAQLKTEASKYYYFNLVEENSIYPHFCTEAFPQFPSSRDQYCIKHSNLRTNVSLKVDLNYLQRVSCFINRFCLKIYSVKSTFHEKSHIRSV